MHSIGNGKGETYSDWKACYVLFFSAKGGGYRKMEAVDG